MPEVLELCDDSTSFTHRRSVLFSETALRTFLAAAAKEYADITPTEPRPCFGVLLGTSTKDTYLVDRIEFGRNARTTCTAARTEFETTIVPRFGTAYENPVRAWWLDPQDLLHISKRADRANLDVLGSIHLHPDWHRLGPESERANPLSDRPSAMDEYVFRNCGWPVNIVCYLEQQHGSLYYSAAAWDRNCQPLPLRVRAGAPT